MKFFNPANHGSDKKNETRGSGLTSERHCEVRSNPKLCMAALLVGDCFVVPPRNDGCWGPPIQRIMVQTNNTKQDGAGLPPSHC